MLGPQIGAAVQVRLAQLQWPLSELVHRMNTTGLVRLSPAYLARLVRGQIPHVPPAILQALARALHLPVQELIQTATGCPGPPLEEMIDAGIVAGEILAMQASWAYLTPDQQAAYAAIVRTRVHLWHAEGAGEVALRPGA